MPLPLDKWVIRNTTSCHSQSESVLRPSQPAPKAASYSSASKKRAAADAGDSTNSETKFHYQPSWEKEFTWLGFGDDSGSMFCKVCRLYPHLAERGNQFVQGTKHFKKETVRHHGTSLGHLAAVRAFQSKGKSPEDTPLGQAFRRAFSQWEEAKLRDLTIKMNTAYFIGKKERPFTDFPHLLTLQYKNGLDVKNSYCNDKQCAEMIACIATTMKQQLKNDLNSARYLAVLADGCTDISVSENEQVHVRFVSNGQAVSRFAGIHSPESANAVGVYGSIQAVMNDYPDWKTKVVCYAADGAAVNLGAKNGVAALMKQDIGTYLTELHCWAHNLELAAQDARKHAHNNILKDVNELLIEVWKVYHFSPKARRELGLVAGSLNIHSFTPVKLAGTRWVPHLTRALHQLLHNALPAILMHMEHRQTDPKSRVEASSKAARIRKKLKNKDFVNSCYFVLDVYDGLRELSEYFQRDIVTLPIAAKKLKQAVTNLDIMTETPKPGGHYETKARPDKEGPLPAKLSNVAQDASVYLKQRFAALLGPADDGTLTAAEAAIHAMLVFDVGSWPKDLKSLAVFGRSEIQTLLDHYEDLLVAHGCNTNKVQNEWYQLKVLARSAYQELSTAELFKTVLTEEDNKTTFANIGHLLEILLALPVSTAGVERGFSTMKRVKSDHRACLKIDTLDDLMRLSIDGPSWYSFDSRAAMVVWETERVERGRRPHYKTWPTPEEFDILKLKAAADDELSCDSDSE